MIDMKIDSHHYTALDDEFIDIWDKHKADMVLIARRMRPVLYPGK